MHNGILILMRLPAPVLVDPLFRPPTSSNINMVVHIAAATHAATAASLKLEPHSGAWHGQE